MMTGNLAPQKLLKARENKDLVFIMPPIKSINCLKMQFLEISQR